MRDKVMEKKPNESEKAKAGFMTSTGQKLRQFAKREDGAAAVEFAFVVPIMLSLYFGSMELSQGIEVNKKAGRASNLVGDLVTQQAVVTKSEIIAIANIAAATLQPYRRSGSTVEVVGIQVNDETPPKAKVAWSQRVVGGTGNSFLTVGDNITIPSKFLIPNTFLVRGGLTINYLPFTTWQIKSVTGEGKGIAMGESYYFRPRGSPIVACNGC
jgi:Flp pilus assembly protein TadG